MVIGYHFVRLESISFGRLLFLAGLALAVVLPVRLWVIEPISIPTASMEPTLKVGAHLFCDRLTLRRRDPERGDIVVFRPPTEDGREFVKRVVALPGETVEVRKKAVYVNGRPLEEPYAVHSRADEALEGDDLAPVAVPLGAYFVLGDNRDESADSLTWRDSDGNRLLFVPRGNISGLVRGIY